MTEYLSQYSGCATHWTNVDPQNDYRETSASRPSIGSPTLLNNHHRKGKYHGIKLSRTVAKILFGGRGGGGGRVNTMTALREIMNLKKHYNLLKFLAFIFEIYYVSSTENLYLFIFFQYSVCRTFRLWRPRQPHCPPPTHTQRRPLSRHTRGW